MELRGFSFRSDNSYLDQSLGSQQQIEWSSCLWGEWARTRMNAVFPAVELPFNLFPVVVITGREFKLKHESVSHPSEVIVTSPVDRFIVQGYWYMCTSRRFRPDLLTVAYIDSDPSNWKWKHAFQQNVQEVQQEWTYANRLKRCRLLSL